MRPKSGVGRESLYQCVRSSQFHQTAISLEFPEVKTSWATYHVSCLGVTKRELEPGWIIVMDDLGQGHKSGPWARVKSRHSETALTPSSSLSSPSESPPSISSGHLQRAMQIAPLYFSLGITQIFCLFETKALCIPGTVERNNSIWKQYLLV